MGMEERGRVATAFCIPRKEICAHLLSHYNMINYKLINNINRFHTLRRNKLVVPALNGD